MIFESLDPLESRMQFKTRSLRTWIALLGGFAVLFVVLRVFFLIMVPGVLGALLAFLGAATSACIFYFIMEGRPVRVECPSCGKLILSNTPWVCGSCNAKNLNVDLYSFVNKCEHCGIAPKAYLCHHTTDGKPCNTPIFLTVDESEQNMARCLNTRGAAAEDEADTRLERERLREKRVKEHAVTMAELDVTLKGLKAQIEGPKVKPKRENAIRAFDDEYDGTMAIEEHLAKRLREIEGQFKDNPALLKRAKKALEEAARRHIL